MEDKYTLNKQALPLQDSFGRIHNYLRLSITDRCNLRCSYCMPTDPVFMPSKQLLQVGEIADLAKTFTDLGISKIRITGGEPLSRKDFPEIVHALAELPVSLHLTTNGFFADQYIYLIAAHFNSVNVSLDTLREDRFKSITQRNAFRRTLENIDLLLDRGIRTKLNVVVIRNVNDDEINDFIALTKTHNLEIRFIEFMPFRGNRWQLAQTFPCAEILQTIRSVYQTEALNRATHQTSTNYRISDHQGSFGIISTVSEPFCGDCNRIRVTADGKLKNCLFSNEENDLRPLIGDPERLGNLIRNSISKKFPSYGGNQPMGKLINGNPYERNRTMTSIGG